MFLWTGAAALLPSVFLLRYFLKSDRFPEPGRVLFGTFIRGIAICVPVVILGQFISSAASVLSSDVTRQLIEAFVVAALCEEGFKLLVLHSYCNGSGELDEPMDGVVYGVVVSLGFATLEDVLYVFEGGLSVAILRAFTAVPAHAAFGVIMGYNYVRYRFGFGGKGLGLTGVLAAPVIVHGLYDAPLFLLQVESISGRAVFALGLLGAFFGLGFWMFRRVKRVMAELKTHQFSSGEA